MLVADLYLLTTGLSLTCCSVLSPLTTLLIPLNNLLVELMGDDDGTMAECVLIGDRDFVVVDDGDESLSLEVDGTLNTFLNL